jgi:cysteine-rich repeat protein
MEKEVKLKLFFLISVAFLLGFISTGYFVGLFGNLYYQPPACIDSDLTSEYPDGENPFTAGRVTSYDEFGVPYTLDDYCNTNIELKEYICGKNDIPIKETVVCEIACENAVCVQECTDTCESLGFSCGTQTVCGEQVSCGICPDEGSECVLGQCLIQCGNGKIDKDEECDDNNLEDGDGCSSTCKSESFCYDGTPFDTCSNLKPTYCNNQGELIENCSSCGCSLNYICNSTTNECYSTLIQICDDGTNLNNCSETKPLFCKSIGVLEERCSNCGCPEGLECNAETNSCEQIEVGKINQVEEQEVFIFVIARKEGGGLSLKNVIIDLASNTGPTSQPEGDFTLKILSGNGDVLYSQKVVISSEQEEIITSYYENAETVEIIDELEGKVALSARISPELPKKVNSFLIFSILGGLIIFLVILLSIYYFIINS